MRALSSLLIAATAVVSAGCTHVQQGAAAGAAPEPEYITPNGPPRSPFSPAVRVGNMIYTSGQIGTDSTGKLAPGGIEAETRQALRNVDAVLRASGSSLDRAVKCTVFLADMKEWPAMNAVYATYFSAPYPARTTIQAGALPGGISVEIDCVAST